MTSLASAQWRSMLGQCIFLGSKPVMSCLSAPADLSPNGANGARAIEFPRRIRELQPDTTGAHRPYAAVTLAGANGGANGVSPRFDTGDGGGPRIACPPRHGPALRAKRDERPAGDRPTTASGRTD